MIDNKYGPNGVIIPINNVSKIEFIKRSDGFFVVEIYSGNQHINCGDYSCEQAELLNHALLNFFTSGFKFCTDEEKELFMGTDNEWFYLQSSCYGNWN